MPTLYSEGQSRVLSIGSRAAASVTFVCASYMVVKCWQSRDRMFHRLMFCLSIHLIISSLWQFVGNAAVPSDVSNLSGARGTTATCTAQGFFTQLSMAAPFYYVSLSVYSFQTVRHNFEASKYLWMEKYIHLCVNGIPLAIATYLVTIEAFNPSYHLKCWIESIPLDCSGEECVRGPENIEFIAWIFAAIPGILILLIPTVVMGVLYVQVCKEQNKIALRSSSVAKQSGLYLLGIYWTYIFTYINNGIQWRSHKINFVLAFLDVVNVNLIGVWILLIYRHFRIPFSNVPIIPSQHGVTVLIDGNNAADDDAHSGTADDDHLDFGPEVETVGNSSRFSSSNGDSDEGKIKNGKRNFKHSTAQRAKIKDVEQIGFNIFDGSNATGAFAQFVFDGDSEDQDNDEGESEYWKDVQSHT